jgi:hypothetical protein
VQAQLGKACAQASVLTASLPVDGAASAFMQSVVMRASHTPTDPYLMRRMTLEHSSSFVH